MDEPSLDFSQHILNNVPMAIVITDDVGLVLWCNKTLSSWLNCSEKSCIGRTELTLLGKDIADDQLDTMPVTNGPFTLGYTQPGIERRVVRYPLPPKNGQITVCYLDISEEEGLRAERNLLAQQLAQHNTVDPVSGLLNDYALEKGIEPLISRSRRYENPLSVVTMDIINLHDISQSTGQVAADKIIVAVSQLLRDQMRWADMVGRLNSGEFIFILPETNQEAAISLAKKLATQLSDLSVLIDEQTKLKAEVCFGVAAWNKGDDARLLMSRSHTAAQTARENGAFTVEAA